MNSKEQTVESCGCQHFEHVSKSLVARQSFNEWKKPIQ